MYVYYTHRQRELCAHRCTHLHPQVVMEGICTAGTLEEGEVVWQGFEHVRASYTRKHTGVLRLRYYTRSLCATHRESCVHTAVHTHTLL